jgi:hypothetical protein
MEKQYLLQLYEGIGRGQAAVRTCYDWKARSPLLFLIGLKDLCRWHLGQLCGPPPELRKQHPGIAFDIHELNQRLIWGRSKQALRSFWP